MRSRPIHRCAFNCGVSLYRRLSAAERTAELQAETHAIFRADRLEREITRIKSDTTAMRLDIEEKKNTLAVPAYYGKYSQEIKVKLGACSKELEKLEEQFETLCSG